MRWFEKNRLSAGDIEFWVIFVIENSVKLQNWFWGKINKLGNQFVVERTAQATPLEDVAFRFGLAM